MLRVYTSFGTVQKTIFTFEESVTAREIEEKVTELTGIASREFFLVHNGRLSRNEDICKNGRAEIVPRLVGGKGGFGSMLRAIGAQIEKTTNREACRDLSGRRLRDINEEKRLKSWIDKQATREEEAVERKKKKLERLCAQPKHEFKDKNYEKERSTLTEKVGDAVEEGFKLAMASGSGEKRKAGNDRVQTRRKKLALDPDIDSDELGSSSDESDSDSQSENKKASGLSSQEIRDDKTKDQDSGGSCETHTSSRDSESPDGSNSNDSDPSVKSSTNDADLNINLLEVKKGVEKVTAL